MSRKTQKLCLAIAFLTPALVLYTLFTVYPVIQGAWISFHRWGGFSPQKVWVGADNYRAVLQDNIFWWSIKNNLLLGIIPSLITLVLALFFAHSLTQGIRGEKLFRVTFFFPNVLSMVVISIFWIFVYNPKVGLLNGLLKVVGLGHYTRAWLAADTLIPACYAPIVWTSVGFFMVLYLAAIQGIPEEIFDAAKVDGAGGWQTFFRITWPLVWPMHRIVIVLMVIGALKAFDWIWMFSYGFPALDHNTMATRMYVVSFRQYNMGYGKALAVVMSVLIFAATLITLRLMKREEVSY